ncbi:MAG: hypothetical protein ABH832_03805 [bacterium]
MPLHIKIFIALLVVLACSLVASFIYLKNQQAKKQEIQNFNSNIELAKKEASSAEGSLIYSDYTAATNHINTAVDILKKQNCLIENRSSVCDNLSATLEEMSKKIMRLYTVGAELLASWPQLGVSRAIMINKEIIAFGDQSSSVGFFNLLTKTSEIKDIPVSTNDLRIAVVPKENDYALFLYGNNNLLRYDPKQDSWKKIDSELDSNKPSIGLFIYSRRLYSIDDKGTISRQSPINSGFGKPTIWNSNSASSLTNATGLAIDGDVFLLDKTGSIEKYTAGEKQQFKLDPVSPALASADAIWTYLDLKYIYILDSSNKRIIIFNKDGTLKKQITSKVFEKISAMIIDEPSNAGYILDSNKLYKIELGV